MEFDAFSRHLGIGQGRIKPKYNEDYVFVLGDEQPGRIFILEPGDRAEVVQQTDLTNVDLLRVKLVLRVPESLPSELAWEASIVVDGEKQCRMMAMPGRTRIMTDLAANVSKLLGNHQVGIRLELVRT